MLFCLQIKYYFLFSFLVYVTVAGSKSQEEDGGNSEEVEEQTTPQNSKTTSLVAGSKSQEEDGGSNKEVEEQTTPQNSKTTSLVAGSKSQEEDGGSNKEVEEQTTLQNNKTTSEGSSQASNEKSSEDDFVYLTFDLSQDLANYYQHSEVLKSLENIKGLTFTKEQVTKFKIWPRGIIPYFIDRMSFDKVLCDKIREYLDVTNSLTGLRLQELVRPPKDSSRWVFFLNRQSAPQCPDYTSADFTNTGVQRAIIGYDCLNDGHGIASLVMALLHIPNQHNSPDRDKEVEYIEKAVIPNKTSNYKKVNDNDWLFPNVTYDFRSVTHFSLFKNSIDGRAVLKPRVPIDFPVGETKGFSYLDLFKIRLMYNLIKSQSDETIQVSNCKKLYKPGHAENNLKNNQDTETVLIYGKETPKEGSHAKLANYMTHPPNAKLSKSKNKLNEHMKNDPLKWDDIASSDE